MRLTCVVALSAAGAPACAPSPPAPTVDVRVHAKAAFIDAPLTYRVDGVGAFDALVEWKADAVVVHDANTAAIDDDGHVVYTPLATFRAAGHVEVAHPEADECSASNCVSTRAPPTECVEGCRCAASVLAWYERDSAVVDWSNVVDGALGVVTDETGRELASDVETFCDTPSARRLLETG